ncbi:T9SS type A sorting domain-containing protein [Flavobacteriaceae bacterium TK19130]|nr:T9SS type A sorting domain-containing protein [Thermobacterium salinum]
MKKITLLAASLLIGVASNAQVTLSQSVDPSTIDTGGVACWNSGNGEYRDNAFARTYDLEGDFSIMGDFDVSAVEFGQGSADDGKVVQVNIYEVDTQDLSLATFTLIATTDVTLEAANDLTLIEAPITATIPAGTTVAVEVFAPDEGTDTFIRYFPGFNTAGQNNTAWLKSDGCTIPWSDSNTIVADPQEYVINLVGEEVLSVGDNALSQVSVFPNPADAKLNINAPASVEINNATLYDVLGRNTGVALVEGTMNIADLSRGVYVLSVETSAGTLTEKIVKK